MIIESLKTNHQSIRSVILREEEEGVNFLFLVYDSSLGKFYSFTSQNKIIHAFKDFEQHIEKKVRISYNDEGYFSIATYKGFPVYGVLTQILYHLRYLLQFEIEIPQVLVDLINKGQFELDTSNNTELYRRLIINMLRNGTVDLMLDPLVIFKWSESSLVEVLTAMPVPFRGTILVPHAPLLPQWSLPFRAFYGEMWAILLVLVLVYAVAWRIVSGQPFAACVTASLRALSSCGSPVQERITATPQRLQLAGALLASGVVIVSAYQGRLSSLMTNPERHSEIDTVEDLVNTNSTIYTFHQFYHGILREILKTNLPSSEMAKTFSQKPFVLSDMSLENILAAGRRFGSLAILIGAMQWKGIRSRQPLGVWMRSMREEHLFSVGFSFTLRNWPWTNNVNQHLLYFNAFGLTKQWNETFCFLPNLRHKKQMEKQLSQFSALDEIYERRRENVPQMLKVGDTLVAFQVLCSGLVVSIIVFLKEICINKYFSNYIDILKSIFRKREKN